MHKSSTCFWKNYTFLLLFVCILVVYGLSFYKRQASFQYWMETPQEHVVEGVTVMSTMDAYYWLRMARELDAGHLGKGQADPTKGYPDLTPLAIKDTPGLLAILISFGKNFTDGDYYRSGLLLIPILAGLFVFPLFFYFHRLGFGATAVLGGLVGSFSTAYYVRTMMGRVDTDLLNTFFPLAAACFILPMDREKSWRANCGLAAGSGLTMYLFTWWYQQPSFILVYLVFLAAYLLIGRVPWKQIGPILLIFLLLSGPVHVLQIVESVRTFLWAYVSPPPTGKITWPDILNVVTEAEKQGLAENLEMLHGFLPLVVAGFAGLVYLYIRRFRQMIPITPVVLLGLWSLVGPNRFNMYLAPFLGIGAGVLIEVLVRYAGKRVGVRPLSATLVSLGLMFALFFATAAHTGYPYNAGTIVSTSTIRALLDVKKIVPRHSAMFTPYWEYGYLLMELGEFATYHDGGLQGGVRTTLTSKAMTSSRQEEMVSLLSYLEEYGFNHLSARISKENLSADQMLELVFSHPAEFKGENVYVLYLEDMIWKFPGMAYFGAWDFDRKTSDPMDFFRLECSAMVNNFMTCSDGTIDLNRGFMHDGSVDTPLRGVFFVNNGNVVDERHYDNKDGYYLQVFARDNNVTMILVADERLFRTNFNQQFLLGRYDRRYFEEVYNDFPVARVLKVKRAEEK